MKYRCGNCGRKGHNKVTCKKKRKRVAPKKGIRKKRRSVKKKIAKKKTGIDFYLVNASFKPTKKQDRQEFHNKINKAAKKQSIGHGCHLRTGRCDIDYQYKTKDAAERCKKRLSRLKSVTVRMHAVPVEKRKCRKRRSRRR